jgi:hypothetical protein
MYSHPDGLSTGMWVSTGHVGHHRTCGSPPDMWVTTDIWVPTGHVGLATGHVGTGALARPVEHSSTSSPRIMHGVRHHPFPVRRNRHRKLNGLRILLLEVC